MQITVNEPYQQQYAYTLTEPTGKNFDDHFKPDLTPAQMLKLGIFGGDYFQQIPGEFPENWFEDVELSRGRGAVAELNFFGINASQPLQVWQRKGWIYPEDPKGWFLWYCRYYMGRRIEDEDQRQIKRWNAIRRHKSQVVKNCPVGALDCRPKQRQTLLHWAYDSREF